MWIYTTIGFYSVTYSTVEPEKLQVRARDRGDLERLREVVGEVEGRAVLSEIIETPRADYRYRVLVEPRDFPAVLARLSELIDYSNFKNAVAAKQGQERARIYSDVWSATYQIQEG